MTGEDMLDDCKPEPRSLSIVACRCIYPIEAFGQAWKMLLGDTLPEIGDRHGLFIILLRSRYDHALSVPSILAGIGHEILKDLHQLVTETGHLKGLIRHIQFDADARLLCDLGERGADAGKQRAQVYKLVRLPVWLHLDPRQRQKVIDQPRHPPCLRMHDLQKLVMCFRIILGRTAQCFDKARDRGKWRAQLMAGICNEVCPHAVDTPCLALVAKQYDEE